jgi:hypothetical protein
MILYYIGHTATQLAHVQAFVLLASFLASINSLPQSWLLCGQAVRIAQDLGLHVSPFLEHPRACRILIQLGTFLAISKTSTSDTHR